MAKVYESSEFDSKYRIEKKKFYHGTFFYVYKKKRGLFGTSYEIIHHENNDGILTTLEQAIDWINKMEFVPVVEQVRYYGVSDE